MGGEDIDDAAIQAHENVHAAHCGPAIVNVAPDIEAALEGSGLFVPDFGQGKAQAIADIKASDAWQDALDAAFASYLDEFRALIIDDHGTGGALQTIEPTAGPAYHAEHLATQPMINTIKAFRAAQTPPLTGCDACGD